MELFKEHYIWVKKEKLVTQFCYEIIARKNHIKLNCFRQIIGLTSIKKMNKFLDYKERERFIVWLEMTAETCRGMAEQMEKIPGPVMEELIKREKTKRGACLLIANDLKNTVSITIGEE